MFISCVRDRQEGKTSLLLDLLRHNPTAQLLTMNGQQRNRLQDMYRRDRIGERIHSCSDRDSLRGLPPGPLLIDDLDSFIFNHFCDLRPTEIIITATGKTI